LIEVNLRRHLSNHFLIPRPCFLVPLFPRSMQLKTHLAIKRVGSCFLILA
jgi:hypothetical protein